MSCWARRMSRLDLAKMLVEDISRKLVRQRQTHVRVLQQPSPTAVGSDANSKHQQMNDQQRSYRNLGLLGANAAATPSFLLLSTSRHSPETASCAAGGRLLVGFGTSSSGVTTSNVTTEDGNAASGNGVGAGGATSPQSAGAAAGTDEDAAASALHQQQHQQMESFQRSLKSLQAYPHNTNSGSPFPEQAGGAIGLNAALSAGLQLLSRYRLQSRWTENFGLGRS